MSGDIFKFANGVCYRNGTGVSDNDVIFQADAVSECDSFHISSDTGLMDVFVSLDGVTYCTVAQAMQDMNDTSSTLVAVTAAGRNFGFRGKFLGIRVLQNGGAAVTKAALIGGNLGSRW
jgi:hypothetical protein